MRFDLAPKTSILIASVTFRLRQPGAKSARSSQNSARMEKTAGNESEDHALKPIMPVRASGEMIGLPSAMDPADEICPGRSVPNQRVFGASQDLATITGDIVGPIIDPADWGVLAY
jgi:hypothetical protein